VIIAVDGQAIKAPGELRAAVQKAGTGKDITLRVQHGADQREVKASLTGGDGPRLPGGRTPLDLESLLDGMNKMRDLEHRIEGLEKRLKELEKKPSK